MDDTTTSLIDHLEELRMRIFKTLCAVLLMYIPGYFLARPAIELLRIHACPPGSEFYYAKPMSLFFTEISLGLVFALLFASPVIAYQLWQFVAPALYRRERAAVRRLSGVSCLLFLFGILFAAFFIFPSLMRFSYGMQTEGIKPLLHVDEVIMLAVMLMIGFGIMFQLPIVVFFLAMSGLIELETISRSRSYVILVIFVLSAVLTPPDVLSQLAMALPSWLLFELSLLCAKASLRKKKSCREEPPAQETANATAHDAMPPMQMTSPPQQASEVILPPDASQVDCSATVSVSAPEPDEWMEDEDGDASEEGSKEPLSPDVESSHSFKCPPRRLHNLSAGSRIVRKHASHQR